MYWDFILKELINKHDPNYRFYFTSCRENLLNQAIDTPKTIPKPTSQGRPKGGKKYAVSADYPGIFLTEREAHTAFHLLKNRNTQAVADQLQLSSRTVEFYLKNIKAKLGCKRKAELIQLLRDCGIPEKTEWQKFDDSSSIM